MNFSVQTYDSGHAAGTEIPPETQRAVERYDAFVSRHPQAMFQQTTAWARVVAPLSPDRPILLLVECNNDVVGGVVVNLYEHPLGNILTSNPHAGSAGSLVIAPDTDRERVAGLLVDRVLSLASEFRCVTVTLTSNPFEAADPVELCLKPDYQLRNVVNYIPVEEIVSSEGDIHLRDARRRSNLKRNLRHASEAGLTVEVDSSAEALTAWHGIHSERVSELGGTPIPLELFENACQSVASRSQTMLLVCRDASGAIVGGGFHVFNRNIADIFMLSSRAEAIRQGANYLLTVTALRWARQQGISIYNWQASNPPSGGVVEFKRQWSDSQATYRYLTKVTGDLAPILAAGVARVRKAYQWHYVVPFAIFEDPVETDFNKSQSDLFRPF